VNHEPGGHAPLAGSVESSSIASRCIESLSEHIIMTPLGFSGLAETLVVVWVVALVAAAIEVAIVKPRNWPPVRSVLFAVSRFVRYGCMFTIFGIAQKANNLGLITYSLYLFTLLMVALAVAAAGAFPARAKDLR
jgi:hypothetical protein